ncbi:hypothetical protein [Harryflintia acetispora]|uniref:hypothetical protein n=1 Tax=Harryflintia acetispora TaxID=1849041 RepID=UPI00140496EB|nr:hypothetical protein [Harryflintia acetispora]
MLDNILGKRHVYAEKSSKEMGNKIITKKFQKPIAIYSSIGYTRVMARAGMESRP